MRHNFQHSFGGHRDTQHAFGDTRPPIAISGGGGVTHAIIMANGSTYIRLFPNQALRVYNAAMKTNSIFGDAVATLTPLMCIIGQCAFPTSAVPLTQAQYNAVLVELNAIKNATMQNTTQSSGYLVPRTLKTNTVAQKSIKSILQPGGLAPVHGSFATDPTMSTRPRLLNSPITTAGSSVPDPALITTVGQQSIDPGFVNQSNLVAGDETGPTGPTIPITIPNLFPTAPASAPVPDNKILGMDPPVAIAVGIGAVAILAFVLLRK